MDAPLTKLNPDAILALMTTPCEHCAKARQALEALEDALRRPYTIRLSGTATLPCKDEDSRPEVAEAWSVHNLKVACDRCDGRGHVPTEFGKQVLAFVAAFQGRAGAWVPAKADPCPF